MTDSAKSNTILVLAAALLAGAAAGGVALWWQNAALADQIVAEANQLTVLRSETKNRAEVLSLATTMAPAAKTVGAYFLSADTAAQFIEQIESLGQAAGVNVKISQATVKTGLSLNLEVAGKFSQIINLIHLLESAPFYVQITKVSINTTPSDDAKEAGKWLGTISLTLLSFEP